MKGSVGVHYTKSANKASKFPSDEVYSPQTYFGDAMMLVPVETQFRLKVRITCTSRSCHCFTLTKDDYEYMRGAYLPIVQAMDKELDRAFIKRWLRFQK